MGQRVVWVDLALGHLRCGWVEAWLALCYTVGSGGPGFEGIGSMDSPLAGNSFRWEYQSARLVWERDNS